MVNSTKSKYPSNQSVSIDPSWFPVAAGRKASEDLDTDHWIGGFIYTTDNLYLVTKWYHIAIYSNIDNSRGSQNSTEKCGTSFQVHSEYSGIIQIVLHQLQSHLEYITSSFWYISVSRSTLELLSSGSRATVERLSSDCRSAQFRVLKCFSTYLGGSIFLSQKDNFDTSPVGSCTMIITVDYIRYIACKNY